MLQNIFNHLMDTAYLVADQMHRQLQWVDHTEKLSYPWFVAKEQRELFDKGMVRAAASDMYLYSNIFGKEAALNIATAEYYLANAWMYGTIAAVVATTVVTYAIIDEVF